MNGVDFMTSRGDDIGRGLKRFRLGGPALNEAVEKWTKICFARSGQPRRIEQINDLSSELTVALTLPSSRDC